MASRRKLREPLVAPAARARVPFAFVLDELEPLELHTRPMFGCTAVYVGEKIVFLLRDRTARRDDNGVWIATTREHHASLRAEFPCMRSIASLAGGDETGWQNLPADHDDFEEAVLKACALVRAGDPRIGKVPRRKTPRAAPPPISQMGAPPRGGPPRQGPPLQGPPLKGPPTRPPPSRTVRRRDKPRR